MEEKICHGAAMGDLDSTVDDSMLGGEMALKTKILKGKEKYYERKPFKEKKDKLKKIFQNECRDHDGK
jgi:hypothetical protein